MSNLPAPRTPAVTPPRHVVSGTPMEPHFPEVVKLSDRAARVAEFGASRTIDVLGQELPGLIRDKRAMKVRLAEEKTQQEVQKTKQEELRLHQAQVRLQEAQVRLRLEELRLGIRQPSADEG
ncbi:hypothetical protein ACIHEI_25490 [Kitasatospora sp. NPDC051984]|uniref:hypothetical protein n=1 Tax=Kitasatospora sp. NPDC051984 TaxID=3364059 RepID=UPI0037C75FB8